MAALPVLGPSIGELNECASVVAEEVVSHCRRNGSTAVHEAADDGAAIVAAVMGGREREPLPVAGDGAGAVRTLHPVPADVEFPSAGDDVHLLPAVLAHVGDVEESRRPPNATRHGLRRAVRLYLAPRVGPPRERFVGLHGIRLGTVTSSRSSLPSSVPRH